MDVDPIAYSNDSQDFLADGDKKPPIKTLVSVCILIVYYILSR